MTKYIKKGKQKPKPNREGDTYAIIYARVSSERQEIEGHGLDSQETKCKEYINRKGYLLAEVFRDTASGGGAYTSRPGQVAIVELIDKYPYRKFVVVIDDISRFARDVQAHFELKTVLNERDVPVESPNFKFEDTPEGEAFEGVSAIFSQLHRKSNRRQVIQKQSARLESGYWPFGSKKGYTMVKDETHGKICVPNEEGTILKEIMEGFADGTYPRKIDACRALVEKGFWKKQSPEKYIDKLTEFLVDPFYMGDVSYPKWEIEPRAGKHKGIISRETFERIQKRLKNGDTTKRVRKDINPDFPLRGLLNCEACGRNVTATWSNRQKGGYRYYYCQNKACDLYSEMSSPELVEEGFRNLLEESKLKPELVPLVKAVFDDVWKEELQNSKEQERLRARREAEVRERIGKLTNLVLKTTNSSVRSAYEEQIENASRELEELVEGYDLSDKGLEIPYRNALNVATGLIRSPYSVWEKLEVEEKHQLFSFLFQEKLLYSKKGGYRNSKNTATAVLFAEFALANPRNVEVEEIESSSESFFESESTTPSLNV